MTETHWVSVVGVAVALIGSIVVAPEGASLLMRQAVSGARAVLRRLASYLPHGAIVRPETVRAKAGIAAVAGIAAGGTVERNEQAPIPVQVRELWRTVDDLRGQIDQVKRDVQEREAALSARIDRDTAELRAKDKAIERRQERERRMAARIDSRGLPMIGLGVVMTGIADLIATVAWLGWLLVVLAAVLVVWLALVPLSQNVIQRIRSARPDSSLSSGTTGR